MRGDLQWPAILLAEGLQRLEDVVDDPAVATAAGELGQPAARGREAGACGSSQRFVRDKLWRVVLHVLALADELLLRHGPQPATSTSETTRPTQAQDRVCRQTLAPLDHTRTPTRPHAYQQRQEAVLVQLNAEGRHLLPQTLQPLGGPSVPLSSVGATSPPTAVCLHRGHSPPLEHSMRATRLQLSSLHLECAWDQPSIRQKGRTDLYSEFMILVTSPVTAKKKPGCVACNQPCSVQSLPGRLLRIS